MHVMMENPTAAEKGYAAIECAEHAKLSHFDAKWAVKISRSADRALPLRWGVVHLCHGSSVWPLIAKATKAVLSLRQRETFLLHSGSKER